MVAAVVDAADNAELRDHGECDEEDDSPRAHSLARVEWASCYTVNHDLAALPRRASRGADKCDDQIELSGKGTDCSPALSVRHSACAEV